MYTIKQAASRSGVPVELLRAWERRYGVVQPGRTESGYRLYDEAAIARLRVMRQLVDEGWAPSTAAARIRDMDDAAVAEIVSGSAGGMQTERRAGSDESADALRAAFVEAASRIDEPAFERILDEMFARGSFEHVTSDLVMPALVELGRGWADGRVDVAGEHAAAGAVQRRLGTAFFAAGEPHGGAVVLVGLPPGGRHDLGALAFATSARRAGMAVRYLGADLPVADWVEAVRRTGAQAAVIGVVMKGDVRAAREVASALRREFPELRIALGGDRAEAVPSGDLGNVTVLPEGLTDAVVALREALQPAA